MMDSPCGRQTFLTLIEHQSTHILREILLASWAKRSSTQGWSTASIILEVSTGHFLALLMENAETVLTDHKNQKLGFAISLVWSRIWSSKFEVKSNPLIRWWRILQLRYVSFIRVNGEIQTLYFMERHWLSWLWEKWAPLRSFCTFLFER